MNCSHGERNHLRLGYVIKYPHTQSISQQTSTATPLVTTDHTYPTHIQIRNLMPVIGNVSGCIVLPSIRSLAEL
jgi:hypothetical protein